MYILVHTYVDADGFSFSHVSLFVFHQKYKENEKLSSYLNIIYYSYNIGERE